MNKQLIEAMARAIAGHYGPSYDDSPDVFKTIHKYTNTDTKEDHRDAAQAALQAITDAGFAVVPLEPTDKLIENGQEAYEPNCEYGLDNEDLGLTYKAMIQAAQEASDE